jgi:2'-5' RNA ligase
LSHLSRQTTGKLAVMGTSARLFVAVWPPADVLDMLAALPRADEPGVRYTTRDQWHVTLRFLGRCDPADATAALEALTWPDEPVVARCGPAVSRLGRSTVVVVPVRGLDALARAVRDVTAAVGEREERLFSGHLTVARLKHRGACRVAGERFEATFAVPSVALVASELHPEGSRYTTLATFAGGSSHLS